MIQEFGQILSYSNSDRLEIIHCSFVSPLWVYNNFNLKAHLATSLLVLIDSQIGDVRRKWASEKATEGESATCVLAHTYPFNQSGTHCVLLKPTWCLVHLCQQLWNVYLISVDKLPFSKWVTSDRNFFCQLYILYTINYEFTFVSGIF